MNRKEAINKSILKWEILAETGEYRRYIKDITSDDMPYGCSLCQLAGQKPYFDTSVSRYRCRKYCPYAKRFGHCCSSGQPFLKWGERGTRGDPESIERRKRYAAEFLAQLKQLSYE